MPESTGLHRIDVRAGCLPQQPLAEAATLRKQARLRASCLRALCLNPHRGAG
ncbi:hypothetical protein [Xanthomonas sp. 4461]|uniref:hypothetical protein n=1 Tax=Xanthomonas sp. 4461 TaxID=3035313 RepID=UPI002169B9DF|nr:hypothetical protein [Xanthomonas sp. 4461]MCS3807698.1 hypothetical protein [Xanthomonas sp. 4461]